MGIDDFIKDLCVQTAVYWGGPTPDGYGGMTFDAPVELTPPNGVRWEEKVKVITAGDGSEVVSKAEILLAQDVDERGWLFLGSLTDIDSDIDETNPKEIPGAYEIRRVDKTPTFKSETEFVRKVYL